MARTRRTYTPEFKAEAVKLVTEQGYSIAEAARSLGINDNLIRNWKQAVQDQGEHAFPGRGQLSPFEEENRRLRAENKRLLAERDILKKLRRQTQLDEQFFQSRQILHRVTAEAALLPPRLPTLLQLRADPSPLPDIVRW
jgi:transposase